MAAILKHSNITYDIANIKLDPRLQPRSELDEAQLEALTEIYRDDPSTLR